MTHQNRKNRTKELIAISLYQLMMKFSYEKINVKDICEKAGVSRMSFYRYYNSKDEIFIDYSDQRFEEFFDEIIRKENLDAKGFVFETFSYISKYAKQLFILKKAGKLQILIDQFNSYAKYIIKSINFSNAPHLASNPIIGPFLAGGILNVIIDWLKNGMKESPEKMTNYIFEIFEKN